MPAPMPARAAPIWVSNNGRGSTPQVHLNATRSSLALCITLVMDSSASQGANASGMPGINGSISRMSSPTAICTSASCGQKVRSRMNSVSRPMRVGRCWRYVSSSAGVVIQVATGQGLLLVFAQAGENSLTSVRIRAEGGPACVFCCRPCCVPPWPWAWPVARRRPLRRPPVALQASRPILHQRPVRHLVAGRAR
ncbi:hypothetical protein D3C72_1471750 [compost metagenome]